MTPPASRWRASTACERALHGPEHARWAAVIDRVGGRGPGRGAGGHLRRAQGAHGDPALAPRTGPPGLGPGLRRAPARPARPVGAPGTRPSVSCARRSTSTRGRWCARWPPSTAGRAPRTAVFGDDIGDLPGLRRGRGADRARRPAARRGQGGGGRRREPPEVAARADLAVRGAEGAVELLRVLAEAATAAAAPPQS